MNFWIQASDPFSIVVAGGKVADLAEAIETIFPMNTEAAILVWGRANIRVSYKYDLSVVIDDLLPMLWEIMSQESGQYLVYFASNTFSATWNIFWERDKLSISATWGNVCGWFDQDLANTSQLDIQVHKFLSEWKMILKKLILAIDKSGIAIERLNEYEKLQQIYSSIKNYGCLYDSESSVETS